MITILPHLLKDCDIETAAWRDCSLFLLEVELRPVREGTLVREVRGGEYYSLHNSVETYQCFC